MRGKKKYVFTHTSSHKVFFLEEQNIIHGSQKKNDSA